MAIAANSRVAKAKNSLTPVLEHIETVGIIFFELLLVPFVLFAELRQKNARIKQARAHHPAP